MPDQMEKKKLKQLGVGLLKKGADYVHPGLGSVPQSIRALDSFLTGADRETREMKYHKLLHHFYEQVAAAMEFPGDSSSAEALEDVLSSSTPETIEVLLQTIRSALGAISESSLPYLAVLMSDRVTAKRFAPRFVRDAVRLLSDVDFRELREVWAIMSAVGEIQETTADDAARWRPTRYKIVAGGSGVAVYGVDGRGEHKGKRAETTLATGLGRDVLLRHSFIRLINTEDGFYYGGLPGHIEGMADLFQAVGPPQEPGS